MKPLLSINMEISSEKEIQNLYNNTAEQYNEMMDEEIKLPIYKELLSGLSQRIKDIPGCIVDTSCGPGQVLDFYHSKIDASRALLGIDLSTSMVNLAEKKLKKNAVITVGDMRELPDIKAGKAAAVISFFSLHHLDKAGIRAALKEWSRVLANEGELLMALWEGTGSIDYEGQSDVIAFRYTKEEIRSLVSEAGFKVESLKIEPVEDIPMDAIYLEANKKHV